MMTSFSLVFATSNVHKVEEVSALLPEFFRIKSLESIGCTEDIPENEPTIAENAIAKALYVFDKYNIDVFAEDTGLEVDALNGEPGVYSARYAGPERDSKANIDLLLKKLEEKDTRKARFRTCMALIMNGQTHLFEGIVEGTIALELAGKEGFGYDPVFLPDGYTKTFAEMSLEEKSKISHRSRALKKLIKFLLEKNASKN
jgi:XTP/dITP diphosphohydrolase